MTKDTAMDRVDGRLWRKQAAAYLGVTPGTLRVWASTGRYNLPYYRVGRAVYYLQSELDAFIQKRKMPANKTQPNWRGMYEQKCKQLEELRIKYNIS